MTPSQHERLLSLAAGGLFDAFHPLRVGGLDPSAFDVAVTRFRGTVDVRPEQANALGLLQVAEAARFLEDAAVALGFVADGELLMITRYELDCLLSPAVGERLEVTVEVAKRLGRLRGFQAELRAGSTVAAKASLVALAVTTLPRNFQEQVLEAAGRGLVREDVLLQFVHLFDAERYVAIRAACRQASGQGIGV